MSAMGDLHLRLQEEAEKYVEETYNEPTEQERLIIQNAFLRAANVVLESTNE